MAATLDFKNPTVVIVGHWNSAILNEPGWIARHVLGVPEGRQVNLKAIVVGNQLSPGQVAPEKQIWLFDQFGMSCSGQRLELFTPDIENLDALYSAASGIAELLPHTPVTAIGINFFFQVSGDLSTTTPQLETKEAFDALGTVRRQDRTDSIEIPKDELLETPEFGRPPTALNLTRKTDFNTAEINFNYHQQLQTVNQLVTWSRADPISHWRRHALSVMADCYGFDDFNHIYF